MSDWFRELIADALKQAECRAARADWAKRTGDEWLEAQRAMDERLSDAVGRLSEEEFNRMFEAESAKVDPMMALLRAAVDEDVWPRELYRGGL